jgi:hypothetical protein
MRLIKWITRKATHGLAWVAVKTCQAIIFVIDAAPSFVEVVKKTAKNAAEIMVEIVEHVRRNPIFQNVRKGWDIVNKLKDVEELPGTIKRAGKMVWAFATGKAYFSCAVSSGWYTLCSAGYAALLLAGFTFSLYFLGLLSTAFRS